jgi:hypothetical protein
MKLRWFALLSLGTAALCQKPAQRPVDPDQLFQMPDEFSEHAPQLGKLKPQPFLWNKSIPNPVLVVPRLKQNNQQIDPKIIIRPPGRSQPKGQDFAHHLYPDLKFLPLQRGPRLPR